MFCYMASVEDLEWYAGREFKIRRNNCVLPGYIPLRYFRIVVIIPFPDNLIIERMVQHLHPHIHQPVVFLLAFRQESHIQVGSTDINFSCLCRIERLKGFGNVLYRIRVFQLTSENHHAMFKHGGLFCVSVIFRKNSTDVASIRHGAERSSNK